ncbi:hypothetical protein [Caloranaerobacter ferrireducens]|uniref:hypothetical protein n=1 Tax=Caloranaerobacter ferrireducens TaxID=1323370 RepID=UPI00159F0ECF|nr:hypothetical protein [Caloranaerobacter ferrireducens]
MLFKIKKYTEAFSLFLNYDLLIFKKEMCVEWVFKDKLWIKLTMLICMGQGIYVY